MVIVSTTSAKRKIMTRQVWEYFSSLKVFNVETDGKDWKPFWKEKKEREHFM